MQPKTAPAGPPPGAIDLDKLNGDRPMGVAFAVLAAGLPVAPWRDDGEEAAPITALSGVTRAWGPSATGKPSALEVVPRAPVVAIVASGAGAHRELADAAEVLGALPATLTSSYGGARAWFFTAPAGAELRKPSRLPLAFDGDRFGTVGGAAGTGLMFADRARIMPGSRWEGARIAELPAAWAAALSEGPPVAALDGDDTFTPSPANDRAEAPEEAAAVDRIEAALSTDDTDDAREGEPDPVTAEQATRPGLAKADGDVMVAPAPAPAPVQALPPLPDVITVAKGAAAEKVAKSSADKTAKAAREAKAAKRAEQAGEGGAGGAGGATIEAKPARARIVVQCRHVEYDGGSKVGAEIIRTPIPDLARQGMHALSRTAWGSLVFVDPDTNPPVMVHVLPEGARTDGDAPARVIDAKQTPTRSPVLRGWLSSAAQWVNVGGGAKGNEDQDIDPPDAVVSYALGHVEGLRPLRGTATTPVMRRDGSIVDTAGYDAATQLFAAFDEREARAALAAYPNTPAQSDARAAIEVLRKLVCDFPFEGEEHKAAWVAGFLTMIGREMFDGPAPLFMINANVQGTGKSLLAELPARIALGRAPDMITWDDNEGEFKKLVTAFKIEGASCILIDNIVGKFRSPTLDKIITSGVHTDRVLGGSATVRGAMRAVWWGSANNIDPSKDQSRRIAPIELVTREASPEDRTGFAADGTDGWTGDEALRALVRRDRWRYVAAGVTILRAWHCAGRPAASQWGSFAGWSRVVLGALAFAGSADPSKAREEFKASAATDTNALRDLVRSWRAAMVSGLVPKAMPVMKLAEVLAVEARDARAAAEGRGDRIAKAEAEALQRARVNNLNAQETEETVKNAVDQVKGDRGEALRDALEAIAGEPVESWRKVPEAVSKFLRDHRRAPVKVDGGAACINTGKLSAGSNTWTVEFVPGGPREDGGDGGDGGDVSKSERLKIGGRKDSELGTSPPSQPSPPRVHGRLVR